MNTVNNKEAISLATGYISKLLRNRFGKGPESVHISLSGRCIIFHLRNFISPVEEFLLSQEEEQAFRYTRELIMKSMLPELKTFLNEQLHLEVTDLYYDWGLHNASGVIAGLFGSSWMETEDYEGKSQIHDQVMKVTDEVQKTPAFIDSWWIHPRLLIIFRKGITILLEKELIDMGYENILKTSKRKLEKRLLEQHVDLEGILHKKLIDLYADWNFERDQSMVVYLFEE